MIDSQTIAKATQLLLAATPEGSQVILFGSAARGESARGSDLDFLVIEPHVVGRIAEAARLSRELRPLGVPADVLVVSRQVFEEWKDTPNTVLYEAAREGKYFS